MIFSKKYTGQIFDIHSHILPGVDDGSGSMEQSLHMLQQAASQGITHVMLTPHYKAGRHNASESTLRSRLQELRAEAAARGIDVTLYLGNEVYYYSDIEGTLGECRILTLNGSECLLLEFSPMEQYNYIRNALTDIAGMGYTPVLAHAERYQCLTSSPALVRELSDMGVYIQVNASSVTGKNGSEVKHFVKKLLKEQLVDLIGTDAHDDEHRTPDIRKCADMIVGISGAEYAVRVLFGNAMSLIR